MCSSDLCSPVDARDAITHPVMPSITKLYGQMTPNTKSGGCHGGRTSERYQSSPVDTQMPLPNAYVSTRTVAADPTRPRLMQVNIDCAREGHVDDTTSDLIRQVFENCRELTRRTGRPFSPDGHLVGSLGEVFAAGTLELQIGRAHV